MRIARKTFARVQEYFPECSIMVEDLEAHVQAAEARMFPQKKAEQEAWLQAVVQSVIPKVYVARGRVSLFTTMSRHIPLAASSSPFPPFSDSVLSKLRDPLF